MSTDDDTPEYRNDVEEFIEILPGVVHGIVRAMVQAQPAKVKMQEKQDRFVHREFQKENILQQQRKEGIAGRSPKLTKLIFGGLIFMFSITEVFVILSTAQDKANMEPAQMAFMGGLITGLSVLILGLVVQFRKVLNGDP